MKRHWTLMIAGLVCLGCGDSTEPVPLSGTISFSYSVDGVTSTYTAGGVAPKNGSLGTTPWAAATQDETQAFSLGGVVPTSPTTWDVVAVSTQRMTPGSTTLAASCTFNSACSSIILGIALDGATLDSYCYVSSGTVTLAIVTSSRVAGTFAGNGTCLKADDSSSTFSVISGTFDMPIVTFKP